MAQIFMSSPMLRNLYPPPGSFPHAWVEARRSRAIVALMHRAVQANGMPRTPQYILRNRTALTSASCYHAAMTAFSEAARDRKLLIGVVHLRPLPGSPNAVDLATTIAAARDDVTALVDAGFDGYVVENFGDVPFYKNRVPPQVITCMTRVALELERAVASSTSGGGNLLVGANVLRNDARGALAVATAASLQFVRVNVHTGAMVTDQGLIEGQAADTVRQRDRHAPGVAILADVKVKHAAPLATAFNLADSARETAYRGLADGLIVTGSATGNAVDPGELQTVRNAVPDRPLLVGSGATAKSVAALLDVADGIIVGSALKDGSDVRDPVSADRARRFVEAARS